MLYDFPVRLSVTVRDSVLALEVAGCPMSLARSEWRWNAGWVEVGAGILYSPEVRGTITMLVAITCFVLSRSGT